MDINTLESGLTVMCIGFCMVFGFLLILIFSMNIMSKIVAFLDKIYPAVSNAATPVKKAVPVLDDEIAVAIAAAILQKNR